MTENSKTAIIGGGAMGATMAAALVGTGAVRAADIVVATPHPAKCDVLAALGIEVISDNVEAVKDASLVVVAVKPWVLPEVVAQIAPAVAADVEVTAIVAGVTVDDYINMWGDRVPASLSISMPNTAMAVSESMTFIVECRGVAQRATDIFGKLGRVMVIPERELGAAMALASCGIAYAMRYVRAASEGGVELGLRADEAKEIVAQTLKGAAAILSQPGSHPETEIDRVTTPGGFTIRGLNEMERNGFTAAVIAGLKASVK